MDGMPTPPKPEKKLTPRMIASRQLAEEKKKRKLHAIGERRAKAQGMTRQQYVSEIVKGNFRGITAEEIAAEPDPEIEEPATAAPEA
jgi:hypothetical protein